jgi:uncharacterized membrane protein
MGSILRGGHREDPIVDIYSIFKFLHVICAIAWVGGGLTLLANSIFAIRAKGEMETLKGLSVMDSLAKTWFIPASMLTVLFGAITTTFGGMWLELWVILGLAGFASTFVTGILVFEPMGKKISELVAAGRNDEALLVGRRLLRIAKFDYTVMLVVIADMVIKPNWTDFVTLGVFAAAIAAGAWFFLLGGKLSQAAQPA